MPGRFTTFTVQFAPRSAGSKVALLTITSNDPYKSPYLIQLRGSTPNSDNHGEKSGGDTASRATAASAKPGTPVPDIATPGTTARTTPGTAGNDVRKSAAGSEVAVPVDVPGDLALYKLWTYAFSGDQVKAAEADAMPEEVIVEDNGHDYGGLTFQRLKAVDVLAYGIEESPDGTAWQALPTPWHMVGDPVDQGDGTEQVTVRSNTQLTAANQGYMRLRVDILP